MAAPGRANSAVIGLLTGPVGVGKTTIARRAVDLARSRGTACGGLLAPALLDGRGEKVGIWGLDAGSGERRLLARTEADLGGPSVGPYSFSAQALAWGVTVIGRALGRCDLLVVDEIGKLELWQDAGLAPVLWQDAGLAPVLPWLAAGKAGRALVVVRDFLLAETQQRLGPAQQTVFWTDLENRDGMPARIVAQLLDLAGEDAGLLGASQV
jgi:hypothetical protein